MLILIIILLLVIGGGGGYYGHRRWGLGGGAGIGLGTICPDSPRCLSLGRLQLRLFTILMFSCSSSMADPTPCSLACI